MIPLLALGAAGLAAGVLRSTSARRARFELTHTEVVMPSLAAAHDGLVIGQLSDLHVGWSTPTARVHAAVDALNASGAELVALTGDYVSYNERPLAHLQAALERLRAPTFAVLGNHDHWVNAKAVRAQLEQAGCTVLQNENTRVRLRGAVLRVAGIDDERSGNANVARALQGVRGACVVLTHLPATARALPENAGWLCLTGHTHGGQVNVPGLTDRLFAAAGHPYVAGSYAVRGNHLYVNRGLAYGTGSVAVRFRAAPEVSLFTLRRRASPR